MPKPSKKKASIPHPDYAHWVRMPMWSRDEVLALFLGLDPNANESFEDSTIVVREGQNLKQLIQRAFDVGAFISSNYIAPDKCLSWALSCRIEVPSQLTEAAKKHGIVTKDWHHECVQRDIQIERLQKELSEAIHNGSSERVSETTSSLKREASTLRLLLLAMAVDKFRLQRDAKNSSVASNIVSAVQRVGLSVTDDTVRRHLKKAVEEHGSNATFAEDE